VTGVPLAPRVLAMIREKGSHQVNPPSATRERAQPIPGRIGFQFRNNLSRGCRPFPPGTLASREALTKKGGFPQRRSNLRVLAERFSGRSAMQDPHALRRLAKRCRNSVTGLTPPAVASQLRLWAVELADKADEAEREAMICDQERMSPSGVKRRAKAPRCRRRGYHARFAGTGRDERWRARDLREEAKRLRDTSKRVVAECVAEVSRAGELVDRARAAVTASMSRPAGPGVRCPPVLTVVRSW
jgi:hypothetical protein